MHSLSKTLWTTACLVVAVGSGCGAEKLSEPETLGQLSVAEAETLAESFVLASENCDVATLEEILDLDAALRRGLLSSTLSTRSQNWLYDKSSDRRSWIRPMLCTAEGTGLSLISIRNFSGSSQRSALFRLDFGEDAGVDYIELLMGKSSNGTAIADDVYMYSGGWLFSERLRDVNAAAASDYNKRKQFTDAIVLLRRDPQAGITRFESLSPGFRSSKAMLLEYVRASIEVGPEEYSKAILLFSEKLPDDASLNFVSLDGLYIQGKFDEGLAAIAALGDWCFSV